MSILLIYETDGFNGHPLDRPTFFVLGKCYIRQLNMKMVVIKMNAIDC